MRWPGESPAERWVLSMQARGGDLRAEIERACSVPTVVQLAGLAYHWSGWWARPKQLAPSGDRWRSWGLCTGRGFGKTRGLSEYVNSECDAHPGLRVCLIAQNEDKTYEVMVDGESGLVAKAPPWNRPVWQCGRLLYPNGSQAFPFTPERPGDIRGPGFHLAWCSEFVAWPTNRREEAWANVRLMTRLGYARVIWDTTPKRRHPIVRELLARSTLDPKAHVVVRGSSRENVNNLSVDALEEWEAEYGGTVRGREELEGEFIDEQLGVLWHPDWIANNRRDLPAKLERRAIGVDPAISTRKGSDATGLVECGLGSDHQVYVIEDLTGRLSWEVWGRMVIERYFRHGLDCVVVERNKGGDAVAANLRACGREQGISVQLVTAAAKTRHEKNTVYVKEVWAKSSKDSRAEPVASLYEKGRVSHVLGSDLEALEEQQTTWEPGVGQSPNNIDALVWCVWELAKLASDEPDARGAFTGLGALRREMRTPVNPFVGSLLAPRGPMGGRRI